MVESEWDDGGVNKKSIITAISEWNYPRFAGDSGVYSQVRLWWRDSISSIGEAVTE